MSRLAPDPAAVPLAVYVHVPFCAAKCPYCDFNSHVRSHVDETAYTDAVLAELAARAPEAGDRRPVSVFFGGGTPSLLSPAFFERVLTTLDRRLGLASRTEITLEANPGSAEAARFAGYRAAGVNRLSLGVQSLDDRLLGHLGRIHDAAEARAAVAAAREAGFANLSTDLMFGLPEQTPEGAVAELEALLALNPEHIALYELTLEPGTPFGAQPPAGLPDDDSAADGEAALRARLAAAGFRHYEVSNHARPGYACRHNLNYWTFGDYLGLGAGAHGKLTTPNGVRRYANRARPEAYTEGVAASAAEAEARWLEDGDGVAEFALNALRLETGAGPGLFAARTGLDPARLAAGQQRARARGLLAAGAALRPTERGRTFRNELIGEFLTEAEP
jgi:oxygen-independent coproporphyrinogen-3 oxidase